MSWFYSLSHFVVGAFFRTLSRWEVRGVENVPEKGPLLIVSNHMSFTDPPLLGASIKRRVGFMAKEGLFKIPVLSNLFRTLGAFPINRSRLGKSVLNSVNQTFSQGLALVMFPEGTRSKNGCLQRALPGVALIAIQNSVPILPVGITGTEKCRKAGWFFSRPRLTVNIGKPFALPPCDGKLTREKLAPGMDMIMASIKALLPPEYHGYYSEKNENRKD